MTVCCSFPLQESFTDYPDPRSSAVTVYMAGCEHRCPGCQNPDLQKYDANGLTSFQRCTPADLIERIVDACDRFRTRHIVLLGGDPLAEQNRAATAYLCRRLGAEYLICIYTGYSAATVTELGITGFAYVKAGKYDVTNAQPAEKTDAFIKLASSNQEFYDATLTCRSSRGILKFKKVS